MAQRARQGHAACVRVLDVHLNDDGGGQFEAPGLLVFLDVRYVNGVPTAALDVSTTLRNG